MTTYFYQSCQPIDTPVDFDNPAHVELLELVKAGSVPSTRATKLMKLAGFNPTLGPNNRPCWSSDLFAVVRDDSTGLIVQRLG